MKRFGQFWVAATATVLASPVWAGGASVAPPPAPVAPTVTNGDSGSGLILLAMIGVVLLVNGLSGGQTTRNRNQYNSQEAEDESDIIMKF